jgi:hypothetical protein
MSTPDVQKLAASNKHLLAYINNSPKPISKHARNLRAKAFELIRRKMNNNYTQYTMEQSKLGNMSSKLYRRANKLSDMRRDIRRQKYKVQDFTNATLLTVAGLGALGGVGYGIHYLTELPSKRAVESYLDNYEITPEQLKSLESASSFEEKARLLKAWEKYGNLKLKSK